MLAVISNCSSHLSVKNVYTNKLDLSGYLASKAYVKAPYQLDKGADLKLRLRIMVYYILQLSLIHI